MKTRGWVYIIVNKAMKGLIKIGYSNKDPLFRAKELESTGTAHKYQVVYDALIREPYKVERNVHSQLEEFNEDKEWFNCSIRTAIESIRKNSPKIFLEALDKDLLSDIEFIKDNTKEFRRKDQAVKAWAMIERKYHNSIIIEVMREVYPEAWDDRTRQKGAEAFGKIKSGLEKGEYKYSEVLKKIQEKRYKQSLDMWEQIKSKKEK